MFKVRKNLNIYLSNKPTDMRKSIDGLSCLVLDSFNQNPHSENLYIFFNKSQDKIKILYWDRNGFTLHYKRLEKGKFKVKLDKNIAKITENQLNWLLAGLDFNLMNDFSELDYSNYY